MSWRRYVFEYLTLPYLGAGGSVRWLGSTGLLLLLPNFRSMAETIRHWPAHLCVATADHAYAAAPADGTITCAASQTVLVQGDRVAEAPEGWVYCIIESGIERIGLLPSNYLSIAVTTTSNSDIVFLFCFFKLAFLILLCSFMMQYRIWEASRPRSCSTSALTKAKASSRLSTATTFS